MSLKIKTNLIHAGSIKDQFGSVTHPIYRSSTFMFKNCEQGGNRFAGKEIGYIYTRLGNPTTAQLEKKVARLEGAEACVFTASGMGAIASTFWTILKSGDHIIADTQLYGCTYALIKHSLSRFNISCDMVDCNDIEAVKKALKPNTTMIYFETPTNPTLKVNDIQEIAKIAHNYNKKIKVVVDNTFATPYLQNPIKLGADIVVHSATKYINGHADIICGCVCGSKADIAQITMVGLKDCTGAVLDPDAAYMINRGLSTLAVRMEQHLKNTKKVVEYLQNCKYVKKVNYPGIPGTKSYEIAKKQMKDFGGMLSFETNLSFEQTKKFVDSLKVWTLAVSLGGFESLIEHPASMTHSTYSPEDLQKYGISPTLIRLATGLEDIDDLLADFDQAFAQAIK